MAEKRKGKRRKEEFVSEKPDKPTREEYTIAKWLRKNVPTKKTKFLNHNVEYFTAVKAVDALMETHWANPKEGDESLFASRADVVEFLDRMLRHKFFHRAKKVPVSEQELKAKSKKKEKDRKREGDEKRKKEEDKGDADAESSHAEGEKKDDKQVVPSEEKDKKKRKIRLEMHLEQLFVDGLDAYVWIYDPIPVYYWFFGTLLVLGAIAICLFPLWPPSVRKGVYYLSIAAAGFLLFIIALAAVRLVLFFALWALTFGKHHFWLFPNLAEDVGFLASFWPIYQYEYKGGNTKEMKKSTKKKKKEKDSDNEEENLEGDGTEKEDANKTEDDRPPDSEEKAVQEKGVDNSESESENSQKSQTGKDFEMVEREEVDS
ncbi:translocation protein SEC62 [Zootermopsis nevadensis]|uniref:Translocation protein SEC62 n=1 Tax=Zootermopsis nevadensis TaxID=136037 RepID=A0A067R3J3_ZOONE|nr:translocation protein SEC62 [Zootermopsis nevadensis]KDR12434.1 Translocation protein SEC62 [Zootermopsis nevadensis]